MTPRLHWYDGTQTEFRSKQGDAGGAVGLGGGIYSFDRVGGAVGGAVGGGGDRTEQQTSLLATLHCYKRRGRKKKTRRRMN